MTVVPETVVESATPAGGCTGCVRLAFSATTHCLTGCGIGEVLGLGIANALGWSDLPSIALAVALAFVFGYSLTLWPLLRAGVALSAARRQGVDGPVVATLADGREIEADEILVAVGRRPATGARGLAARGRERGRLGGDESHLVALGVPGRRRGGFAQRIDRGERAFRRGCPGKPPRQEPLAAESREAEERASAGRGAASAAAEVRSGR